MNVEALMKRCQIGVGGRHALDDAHDIMAECYGTLGRLQGENELLRGRLSDLRMALASALGWPGGISAEPPALDLLLQEVAALRRDAA